MRPSCASQGETTVSAGLNSVEGLLKPLAIPAAPVSIGDSTALDGLEAERVSDPSLNRLKAVEKRLLDRDRARTVLCELCADTALVGLTILVSVFDRDVPLLSGISSATVAVAMDSLGGGMLDRLGGGCEVPDV